MAQRYRLKQWDGQEVGIPSRGKAEKNEGDNAAPTWQVLLTDGPNDNMYAHLYTTQVPPYLVNCLETPGKLHLPPLEADTTKHARDEGECKDAQGDMPFDFLIRHTRISYDPTDTFRIRLREAIIFSRDSFP
ncbi:hypothetical protein ONZ43_g6016 [Nemania bipapillata]|uniref:Uncharacterized protein n=1 Tax=Nemania bipapillata TaxID=110536 RepID=A0ACC2I4Q1_9PEZI|nr:hypothetical protein ONZ43_g6016 [Nemania bipapillata]